MYALLSLAAIFILLITNELLWRKRSSGQHNEHHRKFIHILVGSFVAFWPYYLSWKDIRYISLAFLIVVGLSKLLNIFTSIHEVERFSVGEICFALAVGLTTFITKTDWIYTAAILQMSIADGMAAIIGIKFGHANSYRVLGAKKSVAGTTAYIVAALFIMTGLRILSGSQLSLLFIVGVALIDAFIENIAVYGLDNLFLPLVTAIILSRF